MATLKNTEKLLNNAIENIESDRACASKLLTDVIVIMSGQNDSDTHKKLGEVAAKYLETLQRSNEQLVKLAALSAKSSGAKQGFTKEDISALYDEVAGSGDDK
jgi:hypothetical protein